MDFLDIQFPDTPNLGVMKVVQGLLPHARDILLIDSGTHPCVIRLGRQTFHNIQAIEAQMYRRCDVVLKKHGARSFHVLKDRGGCAGYDIKAPHLEDPRDP